MDTELIALLVVQVRQNTDNLLSCGGFFMLLQCSLNDELAAAAAAVDVDVYSWAKAEFRKTNDWIHENETNHNKTANN